MQYSLTYPVICPRTPGNVYSASIAKVKKNKSNFFFLAVLAASLVKYMLERSYRFIYTRKTLSY